MTEPLEMIESVKRLTANPGDVIVLTLKEPLRALEARALLDAWKEATDLPNKVIVLEGGVEVSVVEEDDKAFARKVKTAILNASRLSIS